MSVEPILEEPVLPQSSGWMAAEEAPSGGVNPAGLERLTRLDLLLVTQQMEQLEAVVGLKLTNQYIVKNIRGEKVYFVAEDSNILERHLLGRCRPFHIRIFDEENHEIIHLQRRLRCSMCCFPCCLQKMTVESPPGKVIGYVKQTWTTCHPRFLVQDSSKKTLLYITGPVCPCGFCGHDKYRVIDVEDDRDVGCIGKECNGVAKEVNPLSDNFGISFQLSLDAKMKAVLLGAVFLIDFMFYEIEMETKRIFF
ncbi:phospholipid scramblase 2-like isoform X1 [Gigantopelta aegis]|uniref:phospholipid scramblase 2-like isoform X1 n=1 Tax=Gigantopelta aegis TaxID=1735272 RepID=UPI001B8889A8|nr:phospholipid scramblase 2-like isoform X1 [Gigantopelta aegis]